MESNDTPFFRCRIFNLSHSMPSHVSQSVSQLFAFEFSSIEQNIHGKKRERVRENEEKTKPYLFFLILHTMHAWLLVPCASCTIWYTFLERYLWLHNPAQGLVLVSAPNIS